MDMIFHFKMVSDEEDGFAFDFEVPYDMNLLDLHNFIRESLRYKPCEMASFFMSDVEWEKLREFTLIDMGSEGIDIDPDDDIESPMPMEKVILSRIIREKFDRLIYVFDFFNERQLFLELLEAKVAEEGLKYPRIVEMSGQPPRQFLDESMPEDITGEIRGDFDELQAGGLFDDDDDYTCL